MSGETSELEQLLAKIRKARVAYYEAEAEVLVSDDEYDSWVDRVRELDPKNSILSDVGAPEASHGIWAKSKHPIPMGSLSKVKTPADLKVWWNSRQAALGG